ncbi:asparagine synthase (glutamine-hydrolysing) [Paucidesulfovibrio gracilis DSM 16080]|uniref:asparagine synthase (glutamine-hydrolyzing) n=1 Tax=Paucidesulfovibrio gracilis DSM 16080 TaxID=1121449 RepID=A0A1T4W2R7_9BACT|nr:asparagine synthase (glutamine-hydrolyzing) [Paucidesulfovibrio gracilis]SKA71536.1 asparagine synthase (glutamine-hydrolysing) [Paucidesulfovibrio gracilis DSM 16080]
MCGIGGIISRGTGSGKELSFQVDRMLDVMPWRGPDARGVFEAPGVALGHLRLSILDLSDAANQPMSDEHGNVLVFNGEIYNYRELREELAEVHEFRTQSDTEVVLAAWHRWGTECTKQFNGEWAFALYDVRKKELILSRDRFGIKPLYYCLDGGRLCFASEVRALLASGVPPRVKADRLLQCIKFYQIEPLDSTLVDGVLPLEPGTNLVFPLREEALRIESYYTPADMLTSAVPEDPRQAAEEFGALLADSVALRLHADVPVQLMLSGGLDSSTLVALAANKERQRVKTLSYVCPGSSADESLFSSQVAAYWDTDHERIEFGNNDFFDIFDRVIEAQDCPTHSADHVARYLLYQQAATRSKVILEGQGGDEVFGGYRVQYNVFREHYEARLGVRLLMEMPPKPRKSSIPRVEEFGKDYWKRYRKVRRVTQELGSGHPYVDQQYMTLRNSLPSLLHTGDRLQMHHSLEGRYPFLDHRVVEFGMSMPVHHKMWTHDKYILRRNVDARNLLPREVIWRRDKKGFCTQLQKCLLSSPEAKKHMYEVFREGVQQYPDFFSLSGLEKLLEEQYVHGVNNLQRLLAVYSMLRYMEKNKVQLAD